MKKFAHSSGFSMVELMIAVAILGTLTAIAVPNYVKFRNRGRQSSGKGELTRLFATEKNFYAEYRGFHSNLRAIGALPEGLKYAANGCPNGFADGISRYFSVGFGVETVGTSAPRKANVGAAACGDFPGVAGANTMFVMANEVAPVNLAVRPSAAAATSGTVLAADPDDPAATLDKAFTIEAVADFDTGIFDVWRMGADAAGVNSGPINVSSGL